jgi:hypothetical protein
VADEHDQDDTQASDLTDELARKYDPERLLKIMSARAGRGEPLEHSVRARYERRFGVDLGHVRIYTGEFAEEFNRQRSAYAVTIGGTGMVLMGGSPEKSMGSASGQALLAHELTHVAQQARGMHRKATFQDAMPFAEEHELEAEQTEHAVLHEEAGAAAITSADTATGAESGAAKIAGAKAFHDAIEKIKERVIELCGEMLRTQVMRNGPAIRRARESC